MTQKSVEIRSYLTRENLTLLTTGLLGFFVLSSKHIIIYNEETLVLLSFIGFVLFSTRMLGESIESSLNERSTAILNELQNSLLLKENLIQEVLAENQKQVLLQKFLHALKNFSKNELLWINGQRRKALESLFSQQMNQKLKSLVISQNATQEKLQSALQKSFRGSLLEEFQFSKKVLKPKLIQQALQQLKSA
jgi:Ca2+/Na+ antiporter